MPTVTEKYEPRFATLEAARERAVTRIGWLYISQSFGYEMDEARAEYEALEREHCALEEQWQAEVNGETED